MRTHGPGLPLFLSGAGMGHNFGQIAPQLQGFDVFYTTHPVVGLHIVGDPENPGPMLGLQVVGDPDPATPVTGFQPIGELPLDTVAGFDAVADEPSPGLLGFEAEEPVVDQDVALVVTEEIDDDPVIGVQVVQEETMDPPITGPEVTGS